MKEMKALLNQAAVYLQSRGIENALREAEVLMMDFLRLSLHSDLISANPLTVIEQQLFWNRVVLRGRRVPSAYIHGSVSFLQLSLVVNKHVLIPRQETELLAERVIQYIQRHDSIKTFYDVCCGSGCLGLAVKKHCPQLHVVLADICPQAIRIAKQNAQRNHLAVDFLIGDLFDPFTTPADAFVCNPPYLSFSEVLQASPEVRCHEPWKALVGGSTGLEFYERIAKHLNQILVPNGVGWLEIGHTQEKLIRRIFEKEHIPHQIYQDYSGVNRFFFLENEPYNTVSC